MRSWVMSLPLAFELNTKQNKANPPESIPQSKCEPSWPFGSGLRSAPLMSVHCDCSTVLPPLCLQGAPLSQPGVWRWWLWPADVWTKTESGDQPWQRSGSLVYTPPSLPPLPPSIHHRPLYPVAEVTGFSSVPRALFCFQVFDKLQDISSLVNKSSSTASQQPFQSFPRWPHHMDSSVTSVSQELSKLGPLEDTYQPAQSSQSSSSSSSFCSLQSLHRLHSPSSLSSSSLSPSSFAGPCETDESRGFSQYDLQSQLRTNGTAWRSVSPFTRDQYYSPSAPPDQSNQASAPTEEQYSLPLQPSGASNVSGTGRSLEPEPRRQRTVGGAVAEVCGVSKSLSPVRSLQSVFPRPSGRSAAPAWL